MNSAFLIRILISLAAVLPLSSIRAQSSDIGGTDQWVILHTDSTNRQQDTADSGLVYQRDPKSTFMITSKRVNVGIWLNPDVWNLTERNDSGVCEYKFEKKDGQLHAWFLSIPVFMPLESMKNMAYLYARKMHPDAKIIRTEYRRVNNLKVLFVHWTGSIEGTPGEYYGYYYSYGQGNIQLIVETTAKLMESNRKEAEILLNGLDEPPLPETE